jgi:hypothetical protein
MWEMKFYTPCKIIVLYILVYMFLDSGRDHSRVCTKWKRALPEFNLLLISLWIQFWFVGIIPMYLNFATHLSVPLSYICYLCCSLPFLDYYTYFIDIWWRNFVIIITMQSTIVRVLFHFSNILLVIYALHRKMFHDANG